jgi:hypothetical protein
MLTFYNNTNPIGYFIVSNMLANNVHVRMIAINKKPITGPLQRTNIGRRWGLNPEENAA